MWHSLLNCVLCQPVHSLINSSLHQLDFFLELEIFDGYFGIYSHTKYAITDITLNCIIFKLQIAYLCYQMQGLTCIIVYTRTVMCKLVPQLLLLLLAATFVVGEQNLLKQFCIYLSSSQVAISCMICIFILQLVCNEMDHHVMML